MKKVYVAGHSGMVGSAILRNLKECPNIEVITRNRQDLDLCDQIAVKKFMASEKPDEIILAAAKVGGIHANNEFPADFIYENLQIQNNIIHSAHLNDVQKLLFLGSSCIYPRSVKQPMKEEALLTGILEPTNEPYAIAKIAGIKMCESYNRQFGRDYRSVMPTNLYGPGDNYHLTNSHVLPALIRKFHEAKLTKSTQVVIWGTGNALREFMYVDDMVAGLRLIMDLKEEHFYRKASFWNVGTGVEISIHKLAMIIAEVIDYNGEIVFDSSKPDGTPRKLLDSSQLNELGFKPANDLLSGVKKTYEYFLREQHL